MFRKQAGGSRDTTQDTRREGANSLCLLVVKLWKTLILVSRNRRCFTTDPKHLTGRGFWFSSQKEDVGEVNQWAFQEEIHLGHVPCIALC